MTGSDNNVHMSPTTASHRPSRPLPRPPGAAPPYEAIPLEPPRKQSPLTPSPPYLSPSSPKPIPVSPSPKPLTPSPSPKPAFSTPLLKSTHFKTKMQNPPMKMTAAQQLYASSFSNRGPSIASLPPPSFESHPSAPERPPLYKHQVAAYAPSTSPSALRPRSPASTTSSLSSNINPQPISSPRSVNTSFEPQSPSYSERSFLDETHQTVSPAANSRPHLSSASYPRGRSESDGYFRTSFTTQIHETATRTNRSATCDTPYQARSLFPLNYVDTNANKARETRTVSTTVKAPPGSEAGVTHVQAGNHISVDSFSPKSSTLPVPPRPGVAIVLGAPAPASGTTGSAVHLSMPSAQPAVPAQSTSPIPPPPPPPLAGAQSSASIPPPPHLPNAQQQPQVPATPVRPQNLAQSTSPPVQPQPTQQPQHTTHNAPTSPNNRPPRPTKPTKPNKKPSGFMSNIGSSLASSLGQTAFQFGTQALLSSLGVEEEDEEDGGGIIDALASGFASLGTGGEGGGDSGGGGEPVTGAEPAPPPAGTEYAPTSDPSAYYAQDPSTAPAPPPQPVSGMANPGEYQTYSTGSQYVSYSIELPSIEFSYSNGGGGGHNASNANGTNPTNPWNSNYGGGNAYPSQVNIPNGAQQPYRPQQPLHTAQHQSGWNPYQYR